MSLNNKNVTLKYTSLIVTCEKRYDGEKWQKYASRQPHNDDNQQYPTTTKIRRKRCQNQQTNQQKEYWKL